MEMFGGVFIPGRVAAADVAADQTFTQVNPTITQRQTFFAASGAWLNGPNLIQVCAGRHRHSIIPSAYKALITFVLTPRSGHFILDQGASRPRSTYCPAARAQKFRRCGVA
jgi:hypothetical protein